MRFVKLLVELDLPRDIKKQELLDILRKEASEVDINEIMEFYVQLAKEGKYVQKSYLKEYLDAYVKGFIMRIKEIKEDMNHYVGYVDGDELEKAVHLLREQEADMREITGYKGSYRIYPIISLYTTFILDEPIHLVGTLFPGGFKVRYKDKIYYCPVKESQKDNPHAVCGFCIAVQDEEV
jgi:uncharacterized protein (UPF0305 family)